MHCWSVARPAATRFAWSRQETTRTSVSVPTCLAVAARRETVEAGLEVLGDGGNAVDAAVSMGFVAAVVEPMEASIGGSGFMLVHDAPRARAWSVEFPPRAPKLARADRYEPVTDENANATGPLAPCVPGVVAGLGLAHERLGTLPLPRLLERAIELADVGFEIDEYLTLQTLDNLEALEGNREAKRIFLPEGRPLVARFTLPGTAADRPRLRQPDLARTLRSIAAGGVDSFYRGDIARAIGKAFEDGGLLSCVDLQEYRATIGPPLRRPYRAWTVLAPRAPCGSWTALQALGILGQFNVGALGLDSAFGVHLVAEALHLAFGDRYRFAGDPEFAPVPVSGLLSGARARELARMIRGGRLSNVDDETPGPPWTADVGHGTTHFNVIDADGRVVSCTITAGLSFGSKVVAAGTGVLFDSGMAWFDPRPGLANSIAPGKRPLVNMAPLLLAKEDGSRLAVGAAGGRRIISAVTQVVSGVVDHGVSIQEAISKPRIDASDQQIRLSERFPASVGAELKRLGHDVQTVREQHVPFSYEFARPAAAGIDDAELRSGGIHPFAQGFVGGC
jgi:gamma-glutamyltranspeptidase / glutathione hydrolase